MHYFLNTSMGKLLSGIEHSVLARLALFNTLGLPACVVTSAYNPQQQQNLLDLKLDPSQFINIYDLYQLTGAFAKAITLADIRKQHPQLTIKPVDNQGLYRAFLGNWCMMQINCAGTSSQQVQHVDFLDQRGQHIKREIYDPRGFKSCEVVFKEGGKTICEKFLTTDGQLCLERHSSLDQATRVLKLNQVVLYRNNIKTAVFASEDAFLQHALQQLASRQTPSFFYCDREQYVQALADLDIPHIAKFFVLHSAHEWQGIQNQSCAKAIALAAQFDAFIVSTSQQQQDLATELPDANIAVIPAGYVQLDVNVAAKPNKPTVVALARYSAEKRLDHMIRAIDRLKQDVPDIQLDLYGYGDRKDNFKTEQELQQLIQQLSLQQHVSLKGYSTNVDAILAQAQVSLVTSEVEGFCLAILDSLNHGVPVIAYDINYGPAAMIQDGINGYLVEDGNIEALAERLKVLLLDTNVYQAMSKQATLSAQQYSAERIGQLWQELIKTI